jgi:chromate reductase
VAEPSILVFAGSLRKGSYNKMLARVAASAAERAGAKVTLIDLADFPMPLYDGDVEAASGIPEHAMRLKELLKAHDGLLLACPEYNSSISGVLKNAIDWASRPYGQNSLSRKPSGVIGASPGPIGTAVAQSHLRGVLCFCNAPLMNSVEAYVTFTPGLIGADGKVSDDSTADFLRKYMREFLGFVAAADGAVAATRKTRSAA